MWSFQRFQLNLNSAKKNCKKNSFSKGFPGAIHIKTCQRNPKDLWHTFLKARRTTRKCFLSSCQDICGVIFNPKIYFADFGNFKQGFWAWNWFKRVISGFRVCFFNNCNKKNQNKTHISGNHVHAFHLVLIPPCINTISILKKNCIIFQKWRGGGRRPFEIFPKNHPIW